MNKKFEVFSKTANKITGHSHPNDENKWFEFIYSTLIHNEYLLPDYLQYFLIENGWEKQTAYELSLDYEYGYNAIKFQPMRQAVHAG